MIRIATSLAAVVIMAFAVDSCKTDPNKECSRYASSNTGKIDLQAYNECVASETPNLQFDNF